MQKTILLFSLFIQFTVMHLYGQTQTNHQRIVILMMDGFGEEYYRNSKMPTLNYFEKMESTK